MPWFARGSSSWRGDEFMLRGGEFMLRGGKFMLRGGYHDRPHVAELVAELTRAVVIDRPAGACFAGSTY